MATAQTLAQQALDSVTATPSANSSPTRRTPAGPTASGTKPATGPTPERKQATKALVSQIFTRMEAIFPRTFSSAFPTTDILKLSRRELAQELARWPVLPGQATLERAISELKREGSTWPPTIPVLVVMLSPRPADAGLPDVADAWREVTANAHQPGTHRWSHDAVRLAGQSVGWWELTHTTAQSAWPRMERKFQTHYAALTNRVLAGEQLEARELIGHEGSETPAQQAERAGQRRAQQHIEAAGMPHAMNPEQGMRSLRAALGG